MAESNTSHVSSITSPLTCDKCLKSASKSIDLGLKYKIISVTLSLEFQYNQIHTTVIPDVFHLQRMCKNSNAFNTGSVEILRNLGLVGEQQKIWDGTIGHHQE